MRHSGNAEVCRIKDFFPPFALFDSCTLKGKVDKKVSLPDRTGLTEIVSFHVQIVAPTMKFWIHTFVWRSFNFFTVPLCVQVFLYISQCCVSIAPVPHSLRLTSFMIWILLSHAYQFPFLIVAIPSFSNVFIYSYPFKFFVCSLLCRKLHLLSFS